MDYFSLTIYTSASYGASVQSQCKCYKYWQVLFNSLLTLGMEDMKARTTRFTAMLGSRFVTSERSLIRPGGSSME